MAVSDSAKANISITIAGAQLIAFVFVAGMAWKTVDTLERGAEKHERIPWHGNVGVEIATLRTMMNVQIDEQRRLTARLDRLADQMDEMLRSKRK